MTGDSTARAKYQRDLSYSVSQQPARDPWLAIRQMRFRVAALDARKPWPDDMTLSEWLSSLGLDELPSAVERPPRRPKNWRRR